MARTTTTTQRRHATRRLPDLAEGERIRVRGPEGTMTGLVTLAAHSDRFLYRPDQDGVEREVHIADLDDGLSVERLP